MLTSKEDVRTKIQVPKRAKRTRGQSLYSPSLEAIMQAIDALLREQRA